MRCVWRTFLFRVVLSEESVLVKKDGCGGGFVFLVRGASRAAFDAAGAAAFNGL